MNNPHNAPKGILQVLFAAAEAEPLIKIGGLGDVAGSLPPALRALDPEQTGGPLLDVRLVLPFHCGISLAPEECKTVATFMVPKPGGAVEARVFLTERNGVPVYLIAGDPFQDEMPVYSMNTSEDGDKFTFFSLAILEMARALNWQPDVLHANDWHTAISVYMLHMLREQNDEFFGHTRSVINIHNLPFMGIGVENSLRAYGIPPSSDPDLPEWARYFPLPMALAVADNIVAVSPSYSRELLTPAFGCGLEHLFQKRVHHISGILNGLNQAAWDPASDHTLAQSFDKDNLEARKTNKTQLLAEFHFAPDLDTPLLVLISRMDQQKGVDIAVEALRQVTDLNWNAIFLGTGDPFLENEVRRLEAELPDRVRAVIRFDARLSKRLYAGADCLLMPSRYEPCGLAQMIAMRYGCIPLARAVGGLRDTIIDSPDPGISTGFLFQNASPHALASAVRRALAEYNNPGEWRTRQILGMEQDFSWQRSAIDYANIYQSRRVEP